MIHVFDRTYGNNTHSITVLVFNIMPNGNFVRTNEKEVLRAVFMNILHTWIRSLHHFSKVGHCTKQRYDKAYILLRSVMFGIFFFLCKCESYSVKTQCVHRSCRSQLYLFSLQMFQPIRPYSGRSIENNGRQCQSLHTQI